MTWVRKAWQRDHARILIGSIRAFGGELSKCPIWVFEVDPVNVSCSSLEGDDNHIFTLEVPEILRNYYYGDKVFACAQAEMMAKTTVQCLIVLATENLIIRPPMMFDLTDDHDVSVRPVHIKNVGLSVDEPVDDYWRGVYAVVGVDDVVPTVESFVDQKQIRAYFNSAAFSVNPAMGLLSQWIEYFQELVSDDEYQDATCQDAWHKVFLHQAVLSALVQGELTAGRAKILPPDYIYPYNLHMSIQIERRAKLLNELTSIYYEDRLLNPDQINDILVQEPLRSWLNKYVT